MHRALLYNSGAMDYRDSYEDERRSDSQEEEMIVVDLVPPHILSARYYGSSPPRSPLSNVPRSSSAENGEFYNTFAIFPT